MFAEEKRIFSEFTARLNSTEGAPREERARSILGVVDEIERLLLQRRATGAEAEARTLDRFGDAISCLELLLAVGLGLGHTMIDEVLEPLDRGDASGGGEPIEVERAVFRLVAIANLWDRAMGAAEEVIALLKAGFPAAALGRWRTMHELNIIGFVLGKSTDPQAIFELVRYEHRDLARFTRDWKWLNQAFPKGTMLQGDYGWADSIVADADPEGYGRKRPKGGPSFGDLQRVVGVSPRDRQLYQAANGILHGSWLLEALGTRRDVMSEESDRDLTLGMTTTLSAAARTMWWMTGTLSEIAEFAGASERAREHAQGELIIAVMHHKLGMTEDHDERLFR